MKKITNLLCIILVAICLTGCNNTLSNEERVIYNAIINSRDKFKNPYSVRLVEALYCSATSGMVTITATNSLGGNRQEEYYISGASFLIEPDTSGVSRETSASLREMYIIHKYNVESDCKSDKAHFLENSSIEKINKILARYQ